MIVVSAAQSNELLKRFRELPQLRTFIISKQYPKLNFSRNSKKPLFVDDLTKNNR
jgi:hypothetical protein